MTVRKLSEGVVGAKLVDYFINTLETNPPVGAECLSFIMATDQVQYRLTFDDGRVSDWLITFEPGYSNSTNDIVSAEQFNEVI